jgi:hypothetical protein
LILDAGAAFHQLRRFFVAHNFGYRRLSIATLDAVMPVQ